MTENSMNLPALPAERQDLLNMVEELKEGLIREATGGGMVDARYVAIRKTVLGVPGIAKYVPQFLRDCRSTSDFWQFIKGEYGSYAERRRYLAAQLNPLLNALEEIDVIASDQFELGDQIGQGGFGTVYRARHRLLGIDFAVKLLAPAFDDGSPVHMDRFFREARVLFALHHPNIIRVYDVGLYGKRPFIKMELFDGMNLNTRLRRHGASTPAKATLLVRKILEGLVHAHEDAGVVHRDLNPSNIMVAPGDRARIVDFGLGLFIEHDLVSRLTRTGESVVGGHWTAPELVTQPKLIDQRSDLYSVAAIWFTTLTNRAPAGTDIKKQLEMVSGIHPACVEAVLLGLRRMEDRYQSAREMLSAVEAIP
ncbi:serine/threonine-protein kinase [Polyangium sp. 15x6]|uniref:serine/threonine-protein kinase n=1 Tax=Polyangium sp. 15x6 TaxID=3042687 RepID=UPI00249CF1F6|nr:serine/threonine-protein kinase [Polyangium sp. 15x6]MDI3291335.1 serine/threonine-protein kinase [Polyangium sp. 15x6]